MSLRIAPQTLRSAQGDMVNLDFLGKVHGPQESGHRPYKSVSLGAVNYAQRAFLNLHWVPLAVSSRVTPSSSSWERMESPSFQLRSARS